VSAPLKKATLPRVLRKRERTRAELVAAAEHLVADRGMDAVSIDDITEAADVAKGTFYTHFADKSDLGAAIAHSIRVELEEKVTALNDGIGDAALRMANGLSTFLAFAITQPVRVRALLRLIPSIVDPDMPINAGIRGDVMLGLKAKRFWVASVDAAVVALLGIAIAAEMRLTDTMHRVSDPYAFAIQSLTTALVTLGLKQTEAARLAKTAMETRRKELKS
jgi:AcrR family transcriptional regulator